MYKDVEPNVVWYEPVDPDLTDATISSALADQDLQLFLASDNLRLPSTTDRHLVLGEGGESLVFAGMLLAGCGRHGQAFEVAVKYLHMEMAFIGASYGISERFYKAVEEAQHTKKGPRSSHIPRFYLTTPDMLIEEKINGFDLEHYFRTRPEVSYRDSLAILTGLGEALNDVYALEYESLADLKAGNILIRQNNLSSVVLTDFNRIAKNKNSRRSGSPHSMPQEQMLYQESTRAVDMFTLGLIAFWLLFHRHPLYTFKEPEVIHKGGQDIEIIRTYNDLDHRMKELTVEEVVRFLQVVSVFDNLPWTDLNAEKLTATLNDFFAHALAKYPEDRFASPDEFLSAFRQTLPSFE